MRGGFSCPGRHSVRGVGVRRGGGSAPFHEVGDFLRRDGRICVVLACGGACGLGVAGSHRRRAGSARFRHAPVAGGERSVRGQAGDCGGGRRHTQPQPFGTFREADVREQGVLRYVRQPQRARERGEPLHSRAARGGGLQKLLRQMSRKGGVFRGVGREHGRGDTAHGERGSDPRQGDHPGYAALCHGQLQKDAQSRLRGVGRGGGLPQTRRGGGWHERDKTADVRAIRGGIPCAGFSCAGVRRKGVFRRGGAGRNRRGTFAAQHRGGGDRGERRGSDGLRRAHRQGVGRGQAGAPAHSFRLRRAFPSKGSR